MVGPPDDRRFYFGQYTTFMRELRNKEFSSFKRYLRITPTMFDDILQRLTPHIQDTGFCNALPAGLKARHDTKVYGNLGLVRDLGVDFHHAAEIVGTILEKGSNALLEEYKREVMDIHNTQGMKWRTNLKGGGTCHMLLMLSIASILKLRNHLALEACTIITKASLA